MKKSKSILVALLCVVCPTVLFGQLEVQSNGKTVAGTPTNSIVTAQFDILTDTEVGLYVNNTGSTPAIDKIGIYGRSVGPMYGTNIVTGIHGYSCGGWASQDVLIGLRGTTAYNGGGKNYGVFGSITNGFNGTGIFGATTPNTYPALSASYAGYFAGNVVITTQLTVNTTTYTSDYRFKQNVVSLNERNTLNNLFELNPVFYNFKQRHIAAVDSLGNDVQMPLYDEQSEIFQKKHYGLIAQEVQKIYPDLVYEDGDGYLSIDYVGIIPLLIQAVKEQNITIQEQNTRIEQLEKANAGILGARPMQTTDIFTVESDQPAAALYQNAPNPFSQSTEIRYYLPTSVNAAFLCIYDLNGKQLKQIRLSQRSNGSQIISGAEFSAGIYLYALIADGKEIDVKRMILTE